VRLLSVAPGDIGAMRALQRQITGWKASGAETHGQIAVRLGGCKRGAGPAPDARASVYVRTEAGGSFCPLVKDGPVAAVASPAEIRSGNDCTMPDEAPSHP
jgi:hypothetical protein